MADPEIRSTPEKYPTVGALSRLVGRVDKFARAPFGYSNPPVEMLSDLLEIPALYRTGENIAYGSPLTIGAGQARRMTEDTTGAVGGALNLLGPAVSTAKLAVKGAKAAKTAKAVEPEIDAGRRSFGKSLLDPSQSTESLQPAAKTSIENTPISRRTFLRAAASPVVQSTLGSLSPALVSQVPSVSSIVKQASAPVVASLSTPVKAGALNLLKQAHDLNVHNSLDFRDRAAVLRELAQYEGQPLVGEGGLSLKEFMRQLKADPKVYETLMKDLDYLGASIRHSYASPSKEAYLSYEPMSAATEAREARIWDKYKGRFKEPRVRGGEDSPPRMFDPNLSEFYYDYGGVDPAILPQLNKAMEGLPHDEARKIYKKAATEYQKLEKADKSKFYKEAAKENSPSGKVLSTKDLYKREDTPASTMLSAFMLNDDKWFTLPTQDEFLNILRSKGLLPERAEMDPEQLSSIYNNAVGEAKSIVQSIPYDPRHEHIDKYYKGFGIDIPEYVPLSKRNPPPAEAEFAQGGRVEKEMSQESDDPIGDFLNDYEMEKLRKKIAENEAALIDLTPVPTRVETGSDPMLLDVYPRLKRKMEANPELYEYGTARLKDEGFKRPMLSDDASRESWLEYKLRPRGQTDYSDKYPPGMELLEENNYYPRFGKRQPPRFKDKTPWDGYYAEGGLVEYDPDHIESLAQAFHEEELPGVGSDIDYKDLENLTRNVQGMRQNNIDILGAGMRFNPSEDIGVNLMGNIVQNAGPKDIRSLILGLELADKYGVNLNKEGLQDIYANYVDDGSYYQGSYNPKYKAVNLGRMNQKDNSSLNLTISPDYKGVTYQRKFASGGAVNYNQSHIDELAAQFHKEM